MPEPAVYRDAPQPAAPLERVVFVPDCHVPYHDKRKLSLLHYVLADFRPDTAVILGDFADFYAVSAHSKQAGRRAVLADELDEVRSELKRFDACGAKRKVYIAGNREDRYTRYINDRAPEFHGMASLQDVLGLEDLGWEFVPYKTHYTLGKIQITHDAGKAGRNAHRDAQSAFEANAIIGHTHRLGYEVVGSALGKPHVAAMFGWLGDVDSVDYMHRIRMMREWAHGFGIGYMTQSGVVHIHPVPIVDNTCVVNGVLYEG